MVFDQAAVITVAVLYQDNALKRLSRLAELKVQDFMAQSSSSQLMSPSDAPPELTEMSEWIFRGADFQLSNTDKIMADKFVLHYHVAVPTPFSSFAFTVIYLCLVDPLAFSNSVAETLFAQELLSNIQRAFANDSTLTDLLTEGSPSKISSKVQTTLLEITMSANNKVSMDQKTAVDIAGNLNDARISELKKQVDEVKLVMSDNVIRIMERNERLENLDHRTEALQASSQHFKTTARRVQRNYCVENIKWAILLAVLIAVIAGIILFTVIYQFRKH